MIEPLRAGDPARVGPYRLLGRLAAGGMGQVRFAREVEAARRVGGYHTAEVVDADAYADRPWMATAYVPGPSLHEAVARNGVLDAEAARALGAGLAGGLDAIHAAGLVHRDLKPANVLLTADGPRVIDFGIARAVDATSLTTAGDVLGTAAYMSPEQVRGREAEAPSDVFALGCVLHFAVTGRSPFGGGPTEAVVYRVVHEEPDLADVPEGLRDLVADCLRKDAAGRPAVGEVLDRLRPAAGGVVPWRLPAGVGPMVAERARELREVQAREVPAETEVVAGPVVADDVRPGTGSGARPDVRGGPGGRRRRGLRRGLVAGGVVAVAVTPLWLVPLLRGEEPVDTVASGTYSLSGEALGPGAEDAPHSVEITVETPEDGRVLRVTYAGLVSTADDGGTQQGQQGNGEGFTVRTPWTGTVPVESQLLSLHVTAQGDAEDITCRIALDGEPAAEGTASYTSACGVPVDTSSILDGLF